MRITITTSHLLSALGVGLAMLLVGVTLILLVTSVQLGNLFGTDFAITNRNTYWLIFGLLAGAFIVSAAVCAAHVLAVIFTLGNKS